MSVISIRDNIISLITAGYIQRAPVPSVETEDSPVPVLETSEAFAQVLPEIDVRVLTLKINGDESIVIKGNTLKIL